MDNRNTLHHTRKYTTLTLLQQLNPLEQLVPATQIAHDETIKTKNILAMYVGHDS
jgi:hypothetical protein